ncbi:MAG: hypothetical protein NC926_06775 [Candidatus Omnitrophica bacterium]|nr:hypothetical protein [Candidatus Omnitrophota bacterium]
MKNEIKIKLSLSQQEYYNKWAECLRKDLVPEVNDRGYLSYLHYLDNKIRIVVAKEVDELDHDRKVMISKIIER